MIGVGTTLIADRTRWRRDVRQRDRETLKDASAHLLQAMALTRDELSRVSAETRSTPADRGSAAHRAFRENQLYGRLYQFEIAAPAELAEQARQTMDLLVVYRDAIVAGAIRHDGACVLARRRLAEAGTAFIADLRSALAQAP